MWGFIATLVALTMDAWGRMKALGENTMTSVMTTLGMTTLNPLAIVWNIPSGTLNGMAMLGNLCKALGDNVVAPMFPWTKSHIKIIMGSDVLVNLSLDVYTKVCNFKTFREELFVQDCSKALGIGIRVEDSLQYNVQLLPCGELALLKSDVLLPYDELKFLRGNSSLGMAIAAAQAIGYIYGIVVCCIQGLQISPIEAIACVLNIVVLMKGILHNFASLDHRSLPLYLDPKQEAKFIVECKNLTSFEINWDTRFKVIKSIASISLLAIVAYFIFNFIKTLNAICVVSITFFEVSLVLGAIPRFQTSLDSYYMWMGLSTLSIVLLNLVGYGWALIVTFKYWKVEELDVQSSNYLSQVLPHLG